jgi:hypothetical protein
VSGHRCEACSRAQTTDDSGREEGIPGMARTLWTRFRAALLAVVPSLPTVATWSAPAGNAVSLVITDMRCASCNKAPTHQG